MEIDEEVIQWTIIDLMSKSGKRKSICPSAVARAIAGKDEKRWRLWMKPIRKTAIRMANEGQLIIIRKGRSVDQNDFKGIYRLALYDGNNSEKAKNQTPSHTGENL